MGRGTLNSLVVLAEMDPLRQERPAISNTGHSLGFACAWAEPSRCQPNSSVTGILSELDRREPRALLAKLLQAQPFFPERSEHAVPGGDLPVADVSALIQSVTNLACLVRSMGALRGTEAYVNNRTADAVRLFGQALAAVPASARSDDDYYPVLLDEALDVLQIEGEERIAWDTQWLNQWLALAKLREQPRPDGRRVLTIFLQYRMRVREAGTGLLRELVTRLSESPTTAYLGAFVASLARQEEMRDATLVDRTFDALAIYCVEKHIQATVVEDFCVSCARAARIKYQHLIGAELWLQRARRISGAQRADYEAEVKALDGARRKTGKFQTLPTTPKQQEPFKIGTGEQGHLVMDRLQNFDENIRRRFPFIYCLQRVKKDQRLQVARPTLLRLDNIASHLPENKADPGNIIPLVLDSSFTGDVALRVNILLCEGTTASQREAAYNVLRGESDLFDHAE